MKKSEFKALIKEELMGLREMDKGEVEYKFNNIKDYIKEIMLGLEMDEAAALQDMLKGYFASLDEAKGDESGPMTPEEEAMIDDYEEKQANKYALDKEEPLEEVIKSADAIVEAWTSRK